MVLLKLPERTHPREIELYYFSIHEAQLMLGRPSRNTIKKHLRDGKAIGVKYKSKWMIRPDQIQVLRQLIPYNSQILKSELSQAPLPKLQSLHKTCRLVKSKAK